MLGTEELYQQFRYVHPIFRQTIGAQLEQRTICTLPRVLDGSHCSLPQYNFAVCF